MEKCKTPQAYLIAQYDKEKGALDATNSALSKKFNEVKRLHKEMGLYGQSPP